jgi:hypothetical protein
MQQDTYFVESFEGEEGATMDFPLSREWWASIFKIFLSCKDCIGELTGEAWTI